MHSCMRKFTFLPTALALMSAVLLSSCTTSDSSQGGQASSVAMSVARKVPHVVTDWSQHAGALVRVEMKSTVGVLLDEIPEQHRDRYAQEVMGKTFAYWADRAKRQIRLTSLRLSYRNQKNKKQLPLPPEHLWKVELQGQPRRENIEGHDVVTIPYTFTSTILTDAASPGITEPALANVGGLWSENFTFPVDPEYIFQRTGFACMNESQFPPNSMDAEESDLFFDDRCQVEKKLTNTGCHQTQLPKTSCIKAISDKIGSIKTAVRFTRLAWDATVADKVRSGEVTNPTGPDLEPYREEFLKNRNTYRYIAPHSCAVQEKCVTGTGWRHLLMFPTADLNAGAQPLDIGFVDYFLNGKDSVLEKHGVFEMSACHKHYHFAHYGTFSFGDRAPTLTRKNGFCLQPTARLWNNELSPMHHPYTDCLEQGVASGWIDEYRMGLDCQWLDVTGLSLDKTYPLTFETNPEGFLCEGNLAKDEKGVTRFEPTEFKTEAGEPVFKPVCDFFPQWKENNTESYDITLLSAGDSYVTQKCREGLSGPLRNCGFTNARKLMECTPGKQVTISCRLAQGRAPHVLRVCEGSRAINMGLPCTYNEALANVDITTQRDITFTCPTARDDIETGGAFSYLAGALFIEDGSTMVNCTVVK